MSIIIKSSEIKSDHVSDAISEMITDESLKERVRKISDLYNWSIGDTLGAIASHIVYTDEDYVADMNWKKTRGRGK